MSTLRDYAKTCNYNPLAMVSPAIGVFATQPIDGILDHNSLLDIGKIVGLPLMIPAILVGGIEIVIDYVFRRDIGKRKLDNIVKLTRNHSGQEPSRNYDILYSIEAEANARCPYGADIVHLYSVDLTVKDDFKDRKKDGPRNFFNMPYEEAMRIFEGLGIQEKVDRINSMSLDEKVHSAPLRFFGLNNPVETYERLRESLRVREVLHV